MKKLTEKNSKKRLAKRHKIVKQKLGIHKNLEIAKEKLFSPIAKHVKNIVNICKE